MSETAVARSWKSALLLSLLTATCLGAEPLLHLADTFRGVPFVRANHLALTADGIFLYASDTRSGLTILRREGEGPAGGEPTGRFEVVESYFQDSGGGAIEGIGDFLLSPDDAHLYIPGGSYDNLLVMARDPSSGLLSLVQTLVAGEGGLPEFTDPQRLAFSPLGDFLYVGLRNHDAQRILVFARDPATGRLSFVQQTTSPATAFSVRMTGLLMSPGGEQLYSLGAPAVSTFDRDPATGRLSFAGAIERLEGGDETLTLSLDGAISPDGSTLYVAGKLSCFCDSPDEAVAVLRLDPLSGLPELLELALETRHESAQTLALSSDGRHLYLADFDLGPSRISTFTTRADGRLELQGELLAQPVGEWGFVSSLVLDPGGRHLYASGFESRPVPRFDRDPSSGALGPEAPPRTALEGIVVPWDLVLSPGGEHAYVSDYLSKSIATFAWDAAAGAFEPRGVLTRSPELSGLRLESALAMSPDGRRLYAASYTLMSFARGAGGELELVAEFEPDGIGGLFKVEVSPDGAHLYLLGSSGIAVVSRDPTTDELTRVQIFRQGLPFRALAFSPDGAFGYAMTVLECPIVCPQILAVLERDPSTGMLEWHDTVYGPPGQEFFESSSEVVLSPDGRQVYVDTELDGSYAVAGFSRNPVDGTLTPLEVVSDPDSSGSPLYGVRTLAMAADGRHLYTARSGADSPVVFERDLATGRLRWLEAVAGGDLGDGGLWESSALAVSPDSQLLFAVSAGRSMLSAFSRRCLAGATACARGDRFRIDVDWRDHAGRTGTASHLDATGDTSRLFWFFESGNWEMMVKVLDGCAFNDHLWVFAAATTDVETRLTVTDTSTGQRRTYGSDLGRPAPAITDTAAFAACEDSTDFAGASTSFSDASSPTAAPTTSTQGALTAACDGEPGLCVAGRFDVRAEWRDYDGHTGAGHLVPLESESSGVLWFFDPGNWEMLVKVLDGCAFNDRIWVFAAATTDVETRLTVTDLETGAQRVYDKPRGGAAPAITDTGAFAACSGD